MTTIDIIKVNSSERFSGITEVGISDINKGLKSLDGKHLNYILEQDGSIVYVGYSQSIYRRLFNHKSKRDFTKVYLIEFENEAKARRNEYSLIRSLSPMDNKDRVKNDLRLNIDDGYGRRRNAGRKPLDPNKKKTTVTIYLKEEEIEYLGGMETVKRYLSFAAKDRIERKMKNEV